MKAIFYVTAFFFLAIAVGCKSVDLLIDQNKYDEAITLATQKLAKKKKTKDITTLEEAFETINRYNLIDINRLKERSNNGEGHLWEKVYDYATLIENRQTHLAPLLPLVSKSGYEGQFEFIDVMLIRKEASEKAAAHLYQIASDSLAYALETQDRRAAQKAYHSLQRIGIYFDEYKDVTSLTSKSKNAGIYNILLKINEETIPDEFDLILNAKKAIGKRSPWIEYHEVLKEGVAYDAIATISIDEVFVSSDSEVVENFANVEPGYQSSPTDSLGNSSGSKQVQKASKFSERTSRKKECRISASIEIKDFMSEATVYQKNFVHMNVFKSQGVTVAGDSHSILSSKNKGLEPFPFDMEMTIEGINKISEDMFRHISKIDSDDFHRNLIALR